MSPKKVGIDAGGSLLKMVFEENNQLHYKKYPIENWQKVISWLKVMNPNMKVALTGGKAHLIKQNHFSEALLVPEFQATCEGASMFLQQQGHKLEHPFLLVNIGTGTSWHLINGSQFERILGSGVGGGTFTGLGSLLTKKDDFHELTALAAKGEKGNIDLLVKDIYESTETPIEGHLTAANFAKGLKVKHSDADRMSAVTNMIAETIVLLTLQSAVIHQVKECVFIGNTLIDNPSFKAYLDGYMQQLGLTLLYLNNGEYSGALGAFYSV